MAAVEEVATIKDSTPNKRFIGDVVNGLVVVNTLVYIGFIAAQANGKYLSTCSYPFVQFFVNYLLDFWLKLNILQGNFCILCIDLIPSPQTLHLNLSNNHFHLKIQVWMDNFYC